jgi:hypothetical protein
MRLVPPLWATSVMWFLLLILLILWGVTGCGDDDDAEPIEGINNGWTLTTDPWGREWACLMVDTGSYAGGLFCTQAPGG